ncbi:M48 family metalloprotease [Halobaculum rubrum]|uniref:M48 family metalloprotease n=1 Tax=Halobaculum rubrum TaxID=2872158 RepID=UPI001CA3BA42|nr:M48 family metalloprotease [Halobaculum rubrum]QZY01167.1 M48 family metalloprotease [Halobaculum rubrum]
MPRLVVAERTGDWVRDPRRPTDPPLARALGRERTVETNEETVPWRVTERVTVGSKWFLAVLFGFICLIVGEFAPPATRSTGWAVAIQAVGVCVLIVCCRATLTIPGVVVRDPTDRLPGVGPVLWIAVLAGSVLLVDGPVGVTLAVVGVLGVGALIGSPTARNYLAAVAPRAHERVELVPVVHALVTGGTALSLWAFLSLVSRVNVPILPVVIAGVAGLGIGLLCLGGITTRGSARVATVLAAAAIVGLPLIAVIFGDPAVRVRPQLSTLNPVALLLAGGAVASTWAVVWNGIASAGPVIGKWFDREGRRVETLRSAVLATTSIVSSATLLLAIVSVGGCLFWLSVSGRLTPRWPLLGAGLLFATPLWVLLGGVTYQARRVVQSAVRFRRYPPAGDLLPPLPVEPRYSVYVVDDDGFFAAAYSDPWTDRIVLSRGAISELSPAELAAIIVHEESHIVHRGAWLQVVLALAPLGALLGRNVVYSLYDFMTREETADEMAVRRLTDSGIDGTEALLSALRSAEGMPSPQSRWLTFLPTATTVRTDETDRTGPVDRLYLLLFGNFAGQVHPASPTRRERIQALRDDERESTTE